jgi:DNA-directed RNA polymerase subunit M/transcription elongation factor TFIIS
MMTMTGRGKATLQDMINATLLKMYTIEMFIEQEVVKLVKNTSDVHCKACGSDNVHVESKQLRSADEASTLLFTCLNCGNKWKMN